MSEVVVVRTTSSPSVVRVVTMGPRGEQGEAGAKLVVSATPPTDLNAVWVDTSG